MYSIVKIVYGSPLNQKAYDAMEKLGVEPEDIGCETLYSGGADVTPGYCGVELGEFDEATDMALKVSSLNLKPSAAQIKEANDAIAALPSQVRKHLAKADVYFVFCTS